MTICLYLTELVIEEITEEEPTVLSKKPENSTADCSMSQPQRTKQETSSSEHLHGTGISGGPPSSSSECLQALKDDPESIRFTPSIR